jgi:uncharacterized membrane protein YeiH
MILYLLDLIGVAVFAVSGARVAEQARLSPLVVVLMGTMTGVAGGMLRDVLSAQVPMILRHDIYPSAASAGIGVYLILQALGLRRPWATGFGLVVVAGLRLAATGLNLQLPVFRLPATTRPRGFNRS